MYPLVFKPILKELVWGGRKLADLGKALPADKPIGESWEVVDLPDDQSVVAETAGIFGLGMPTVQVKKSRAHLASESLHPNVACRLLREAAADVIMNSPGIGPLVVESPVTVEVTLNRPVLADLVAMLDNVERIDGRTIRFTRDDFPNVYRILRLISVLCSAPV